MKKSFKILFEERLAFSKFTRTQKGAYFFKQPMAVISYYFRNFIVRFSRRFKIFFHITARTFWGGRMTLLLPEPVSQEIFFHGYFEEDLCNMFIAYIKPDMTFIDIGAHFGFFTLFGAELVGESGRVHAFEATPETFHVLECNAKRKKNIIVNNLAVFSRQDLLEFNDFGREYSAYNSLHGPLLEKEEAKKIIPRKITVKATSVDEYVRNTNIKPGFIKIDAECAEYEILKGMQETIKKYRPLITTEVGDMDNEGGRDSRRDLIYIINQKYKPFEYKNGKIIPHILKGKYEYANILLIPEEKL